MAAGELTKMSNFEQRANIKFCFKLNKSATETHKLLQEVYGDTAVTNKTICKWFERFRDGQESLNDDEKSGVYQLPVTMTTLLLSRLSFGETDV